MGNHQQYGQQTHAIAAAPLGELAAPTAIHSANAGLSAYLEGKAPAGLQAAAQFFADASNTWAQINQVRTVANPELTEDGHVLHVNQVAQRGVENMVRGYDRARLALNAAEAGYQAEVDAATRLTPGAHAAEIRAVVRQMQDSDRHRLILSAMETGDTATLAAVLTAPGITTGLTDAQVDNLRALHQRRAAPEALANLQAVRTVRAKAVAALDQILSNADSLAVTQRAAGVKERQRQAKEAAAAAGALGRWDI